MTFNVLRLLVLPAGEHASRTHDGLRVSTHAMRSVADLNPVVPLRLEHGKPIGTAGRWSVTERGLECIGVLFQATTLADLGDPQGVSIAYRWSEGDKRLDDSLRWLVTSMAVEEVSLTKGPSMRSARILSARNGDSDLAPTAVPASVFSKTCAPDGQPCTRCSYRKANGNQVVVSHHSTH